jgi:hypothetical protein
MKETDLTALAAEVYANAANEIDGALVGKSAESLPLGSVDFPQLSEDEIMAVLGRKWRQHLDALKSLVDLYQYITSNKAVTVLALSCKSKRLLAIYSNHRQVSRVLFAACRVGLIKAVDNTYHFGGPGRCFAKKYAWNKAAQATLKALFAKYQITGLAAPVDNPLLLGFGNDASQLEADFAESPFRFKFAAKTRLANVSDSLVLYGLSKNYPQLADYAAKVADINAKLPADEQVTFTPTITRNRKGDIVTKIGIRATNPLVSLPKEETESGAITRADMLADKLGNWTEIDVKSSVPRVTYLLNYGTWQDADFDFYAAILGRPFRSSQERKEIKHIFMPLYFETSAKSIAHHLSIKHQADAFTKQFGKAALVRTIDAARNAVTVALGRSWGSEIFLHESCIYLDAFAALLRRGYRVIQVYDAFFIQGRLDAAEVAEVQYCIQTAAEDYYKRYICKADADATGEESDANAEAQAVA